MLTLTRICSCGEQQTITLDDETPSDHVIDGFAVVPVKFQCDKCFLKEIKKEGSTNVHNSSAANRP